MYLLHAYSPYAGVHTPCGLRIAGLLPATQLHVRPVSLDARPCFSIGWFGVTFRLTGHLSAVPLSTALPFSFSWRSSLFLPGTVWSHPVSPFPPGRPESVFCAFLVVCQEFAVASSSQGVLLLVGHYLFSPLNVALCAEKRWDRAARMGRGATLILIVFNLTTNHLYIELGVSRFYKTKAVPRDDVRWCEGKGVAVVFWSCLVKFQSGT